MCFQWLDAKVEIINWKPSSRQAQGPGFLGSTHGARRVEHAVSIRQRSLYGCMASADACLSGSRWRMRIVCA